MIKHILFISVALFIWAIIATVYAIRNNNSNNNCAKSLAAANSNIDSCNKFCGSKGNWAAGQVTSIMAGITNILSSQNMITCTTPATDYPKLAACAASSLSQNYSYWDLANNTKLAGSSSVMTDAIKKCAPSVPGCKLT